MTQGISVPAPDLLAAIVAASRQMIAVRRDRISESGMEKRAAARTPNGAAFARALREGETPRVIAECKRRSPSRGILREDYRPAEHAAAYAAAGAAAISVLTEPTFFDGSLGHLQQVREAVPTPLLRKDFIVDRYQLLEAVASGADAILLIVGALAPADLAARLRDASDLGLAALVEVHDEAELSLAADAGAEIIGVNSRNLRTLSVEPAVHEALARRMPGHAIAVAESGLRTAADLERLGTCGYHAFLVGERLIVEPDPGAALRALRSGGRSKQ
jgi:indole-3-glycerol phosphate synthase